MDSRERSEAMTFIDFIETVRATEFIGSRLKFKTTIRFYEVLSFEDALREFVFVQFIKVKELTLVNRILFS